MSARAERLIAHIRTLHDRGWPPWHKGPESPGWFADLDRIEECYLAFWVAVEPRGEAEEVVGMVGADLPGADVPPGLTDGRSRVAHLSRMRIAPLNAAGKVSGLAPSRTVPDGDGHPAASSLPLAGEKTPIAAGP